MTSMTRLPAGWPSRPVSHPLITWAGEEPIVNPNGCLRAHEASKTLPVRQITPTYWTTTVCPAATFGPEPLIRVLVTRLAGGLACLGMVIDGSVPGPDQDTEGRLPPPCETVWPEAEAVPAKEWIRSMTNTSVSVGFTPPWELPELP